MKKLVIAILASMGLMVSSASAAIPRAHHAFTDSTGQCEEMQTYPKNARRIEIDFMCGYAFSQGTFDIGARDPQMPEHIRVSSSGAVSWSGMDQNETGTRITLKGKFVTRHKFVGTYQFNKGAIHKLKLYDRGTY